MEQLIFPLTVKEAKQQGIDIKSEWLSKMNKNAMFPRRLRELREAKGISQLALTKEIDVTRSTIGLYESGDNVPDVKTLAKLSLYFNVPSDYLLCLHDSPSIDIDIQSIQVKLGISSAAIEKLLDFTMIDTVINNGVKETGLVHVPPPQELSDFIVHEKFIEFLNCVHSMKVVSSDEITDYRAKTVKALQGSRELWEQFRQRAIAAVNDIIRDLAPEPEDNNMKMLDEETLDMLGIIPRDHIVDLIDEALYGKGE